MDYKTELAKLFKKMENKNFMGPLTGTVVNPLPDLKVSILNGSIVLDSDNLYMCEKLYDDYARKFELESDTETSIQGTEFSLSANPVLVDTTISGTVPVPSIPTGPITNVKVGGTLKSKGNITFTDTLEKDDLVMLVPTITEQMWFIVDKVRRVE